MHIPKPLEASILIALSAGLPFIKPPQKHGDLASLSEHNNVFDNRSSVHKLAVRGLASWEDSIEKSSSLICGMNEQLNPTDPNARYKMPQSEWTDTADLNKNGWAYRQGSWRSHAMDIEALEDALTALDINCPAWFFANSDHNHEGQGYTFTKADYQQAYCPSHGVIIAEDNYGPAYMRTKMKGDFELLPLRQWSDLVYLAWKELQGQNLPHIFRLNILNDDTIELLRRARGGGTPVTDKRGPWPGWEFSGFQDPAFKSLLSAPNVYGVVYLFGTHNAADQLGLKIIDKIHMFEGMGDFDVYIHVTYAPVELEPTASRRLAIRSTSDVAIRDFGELAIRAIPTWKLSKAKGAALLCGMNSPIDDSRMPQSMFTAWSAADRYCWTFESKDSNMGLLEAPYAAPFQQLGLAQDQSKGTWTNAKITPSRHSQLNGDVGYPATGAYYVADFCPGEGVLIGDTAWSPKDMVDQKKMQIPSSDGKDQLVPLQKWSDLAYLMWKQVGGGNNIEHIFETSVRNTDSQEVFRRAKGQGSSAGVDTYPPRWHAWEFSGFEDPAFQSLFAAPNTWGKAFLAAQYKADGQLGHKIVDKINVFMCEPDGFNEEFCTYMHLVDAPVEFESNSKRDLSIGTSSDTAIRVPSP